MNKRASMAQLRRAVQLWLNTIDDEEALVEVATVAPAYEIDHAYRMGELLAWGVNSVGDPQLYKVLQAHTSAEQWPPDVATSLYKAIGLVGGIPIWAPPTGGHDAYNIGDVVSHNGVVYKSLIDGNITEPGSDERWWEQS